MDQPLVIVIDRDAPDAAYEQVATQVRSLIATGRLAPGTVLPGVRSLASDLGVNFNTIARAYRRLEEDGFVRIRDRSGVEVALPARQAPAAAREALADELWALLARMRQAGLSMAEMRRLVDRHLAAIDQPPAAPGRSRTWKPW